MFVVALAAFGAGYMLAIVLNFPIHSKPAAWHGRLPGAARLRLESAVKVGTRDRGAIWARDNVFRPHSVERVADLPDAALIEVAAKLAEGVAHV